jgi:hypothetical protein
MGISISILKDRGIIEVIYSSDPVTSEALAEQRRLLADAISRSNIDKVLLDASALARFPSIVTLLQHNKSVATNKVLRRTRFAVLCSSLGPDEHDLETTGVNRGIRIKCFTSREEALAWLA